DNPLYYLDVNNLDYKTVYDKLTFRLSYFAKERTKSYSRDERSFGCSQS
ncbi:inovirus-type Gp2 protein, partial [Escherichia coli]|nr:inovirus Gp2 family protein [Escherichia coli]HED4115467.1 inovirus-type Gp2 protein [Escherichia coli]